MRWNEIPVKYGDSAEKDGQMTLFTNAAAGLKEAAEVKRESIEERVAKMKEIVEASPDDHFVLWHDQEAERHAIKKALPGTMDIYGSQDYEVREQRVIDFSEGRTRPVSYTHLDVYKRQFQTIRFELEPILLLICENVY